jgi:hypothetical protein
MLYWRTQTHAAVRAGNWKYLSDAGAERLFNLAIDPGEKNDVRAARADVFQRLKTQYTTWDADMLPRRAKGA